MKHQLCALLAVASLSATSYAQTPTVTPILRGTQPGDAMGQDVANAGDVDQDGVDDIIIGNESSRANPLSWSFAGEARVVSGATNATIWSWTGQFIGDRFGSSVDGAGDVDGDGVPDLVVGARGRDKLTGPPYYGDCGAVYVYSGATGLLLFQVDAWNLTAPSVVADDARFGFAVAGAGDVNADGYADIIAGGYVGGRQGFPGEGFAVVISGETVNAPADMPVVLHTFTGGADRYFMGFAVDGAGDVNGDYYDDLIVGVVDAADNSGRGAFAGEARVYDGQTGSLITTLFSGVAGDFFAGSVAGVGDVNRDGFDDVACGIVFENGRGGAIVYDGATLGGADATIHSFTGMVTGDLFGFDVDGGGDADGDGHSDIIIGAILASGSSPITGVANIYSGATGALLNSFGGTQTGDAYGFSVDLSGDHDGDGYAEGVVSSPYIDAGTVMDVGGVEIIDLGVPGSTARSRQIGPGCPAMRASNVFTLPTLQLRGRAAMGDTFSLRLRGATLGQAWTLNVGAPVNINLTPFGMPGCWLYATGNGFVYMPVPPTTHAVHGTGSFVLGVTIPVNPALVGQSIAAQANILAPGTNAADVVVSNGILMTF